ncbi:MAG: hypothetical protein K0S65_4026, partial [Labilithrix sp.]|nr:hypothetical protein [Labilithrix sp.]
PNVVGETGGGVGSPFTPGGPDASSSSPSEPEGVCPTNKCPASSATCPTSRFPCDVNLMTDPNNCGACGLACPIDGSYFGASFSCIGGVCVMKCEEIFREVHADCDGIPDNGCEAKLGSPTNCGGRCVDLTKDDYECGSCGVACAPDDPEPPPPHAYYGCAESTCGHLKCDENPPTYAWADCNHDPTDGCEIDLYALDDTNCGACGGTCTGGRHCALYFGVFGAQPRCSCPPGTEECPGHVCLDLSRDVTACGACGRVCPSPGPDSHGAMACVGGECKLLCAEGYADCNDNPNDGCEVNLKSDPRHCGSCSTSCTGVIGQACIGGACATEPCGGPR